MRHSVLLVAFAITLNSQDRLTPEEQRGIQIYEKGTSPSGAPIQVSLDGDTQVAGSILPCANCHGHDGQGKPEGGVVPSNITWDALTKPYAIMHADGRQRRAYTERLVKRAITMGIDSEGNTLNRAMPRFQLSLADASDLVAYLKRLGHAVDPGLRATSLRLGVILPPATRTSAAGGIFRRAMLEYFAVINGNGGVFGRHVELTFAELPPNPSERANSVRDFLNHEQVFAAAGDLTGAESEIATAIRETRTPFIAALAAFPQAGSPLNEYVFYLDGGVQEELQALINFVLQRFPSKDLRAAIAARNDENTRNAAAWVQAHLGRQFVPIQQEFIPGSADLVFWLRSDAPSSSIGNQNTVFLIPGSLARGPIRPIPGSQIFVALGASLGEDDLESDSIRDSTWDRARSSAAIITHALKACGRALSRTTFIEALQTFRDVQTGLRSPITFGLDRRVGASNTRIVMLDGQSGNFILVHGKRSVE